jgi:hypothetical protein
MSLLDASFRYTDDEHARYEKDGFLSFDRFLSAEGLAFCSRQIDAMFEELFEDYRTGEPFPRTGFLVRGVDAANRGWQRSPLQAA